MSEDPSTWSSEWPTAPGHYWLQDGDKDPVIGIVRTWAADRTDHFIHGCRALPSEWPDVRWGPRIQEPWLNPSPDLSAIELRLAALAGLDTPGDIGAMLDLLEAAEAP